MDTHCIFPENVLKIISDLRRNPVRYSWAWIYQPIPKRDYKSFAEGGDQPPKLLFTACLFFESPLALRPATCCARINFALDAHKDFVSRGAALLLDTSISPEEFYAHVEHTPGIPSDLGAKILSSKSFLFFVGESSLPQLREYEFEKDSLFDSSSTLIRYRSDGRACSVRAILLQASRAWMDDEAPTLSRSDGISPCLEQLPFPKEENFRYRWQFEELPSLYREAVNGPLRGKGKEAFSAHQIRLCRILPEESYDKQIAKWFITSDKNGLFIEEAIFLDIDQSCTITEFCELLGTAMGIPAGFHKQLMEIRWRAFKVVDCEVLQLTKYWFPITEGFKREAERCAQDKETQRLLYSEMCIVRNFMNSRTES